MKKNIVSTLFTLVMVFNVIAPLRADAALRFNQSEWDRHSFKIDPIQYDKYDERYGFTTRNNWVVTHQNVFIGFDFAFVAKSKNGPWDHYLVLNKYPLSFTNLASTWFCPGTNLILTLNGSEKIRLNLDPSTCHGHHSFVSFVGKRAVLLDAATFAKITSASSIYIELEGSDGPNSSEATGWLSAKNIQNLHKLGQYMGSFSTAHRHTGSTVTPSHARR